MAASVGTSLGRCSDNGGYCTHSTSVHDGCMYSASTVSLVAENVSHKLEKDDDDEHR